MADKFYIVSELNGLVLDVERNSNENRGKLITYPYHGGANQQFRFKPNGEIAAVSTGKGLNIEGGTIQGHKIIQWTPGEYPNQLWRIHKDGSIRIVGSNLCIDIEHANSNQHANVIAWPYNGGANQKWKLVNAFD